MPKCQGNYQCNYGDQDKNNIKKWILLDSQSTVDIFCNKNLLRDIKKQIMLLRLLPMLEKLYLKAEVT